MKKYLFFLVAIMLATVARAATITFTVEGIKYTATDETKTAVVKGYENVSGEVNIPSIISWTSDRRYAVTEIVEGAFRGCKSLTSVTLPESLTKIGTYAFEGCSNLTSATLPESLTQIGTGAFENCSNLTSVNIPNKVQIIPESAFRRCFNLASVTIPNSVTKIGKWAFEGCISIPSVTIPEAVTEIGDGPFASCISLKVIIVEAGNEYYCADNGALYNHDMTTLIQCPASKTEFDIPSSVTSIGNYALANCKSLTSVTIPNSVTSIGIYALSYCDELNSVVIGSSVKSIGEGGFYACKNLTKITDLSQNPQSVGTETFQDVPNDAVIYIPKGSYVPYMVAKGWEQFSDFREMGAFSVSISASSLELEMGKSAELSVDIEKDNDVTVGDYEWTSSNPEVATVEDGKVTAIAPGDAVITYTVFDGYGVAHTVSCEVSVNAPSGIVDISDDATELADVYTLNGITVLRNATEDDVRALPAGIYIVRQGNEVKKIAVK